MGSIRNINYIKSKTKETWIYQYHQKKKNEILQLSSTRFHILKPLHDRFIINPASYIFFNVRSQTIIQNTLTPHIHTMIHSCKFSEIEYQNTINTLSQWKKELKNQIKQQQNANQAMVAQQQIRDSQAAVDFVCVKQR